MGAQVRKNRNTQDDKNAAINDDSSSLNLSAIAPADQQSAKGSTFSGSTGAGPVTFQGSPALMQKKHLKWTQPTSQVAASRSSVAEQYNPSGSSSVSAGKPASRLSGNNPFRAPVAKGQQHVSAQAGGSGDGNVLAKQPSLNSFTQSLLNQNLNQFTSSNSAQQQSGRSTGLRRSKIARMYLYRRSFIGGFEGRQKYFGHPFTQRFEISPVKGNIGYFGPPDTGQTNNLLPKPQRQPLL